MTRAEFLESLLSVNVELDDHQKLYAWNRFMRSLDGLCRVDRPGPVRYRHVAMALAGAVMRARAFTLEPNFPPQTLSETLQHIAKQQEPK